MSWNYQFDQEEEANELSEISVSSRVKQRVVDSGSTEKGKNRNKYLLNSSLNAQDQLEDKNTPSTNVGSDLQPILGGKNTMTVKQRNMLLEISDASLRQSISESIQRPNLKGQIQELLRLLDSLESNQVTMHQNFMQSVQELRENLSSKTKRNGMMRSHLDSLRKDLNDRRQQMKTLIQLLKNTTKFTSRQDAPLPPRPLQTLKHYESQKFLQMAQRQQAKLQTSQEKSDKKIKTLHGRRVFLRDKSDSGRQLKNY